MTKKIKLQGVLSPKILAGYDVTTFGYKRILQAKKKVGVSQD